MTKGSTGQLSATEYSRLFAVHTGTELKSLYTWNFEREQYWEAVRDRVQHPEDFVNGLKCPACHNGDLYDTGVMLGRSPPRMRVKCRGCDFKGERYE